MRYQYVKVGPHAYCANSEDGSVEWASSGALELQRVDFDADEVQTITQAEAVKIDWMENFGTLDGCPHV